MTTGLKKNLRRQNFSQLYNQNILIIPFHPVFKKASLIKSVILSVTGVDNTKDHDLEMKKFSFRALSSISSKIKNVFVYFELYLIRNFKLARIDISQRKLRRQFSSLSSLGIKNVLFQNMNF